MTPGDICVAQTAAPVAERSLEENTRHGRPGSEPSGRGDQGRPEAPAEIVWPMRLTAALRSGIGTLGPKTA